METALAATAAQSAHDAWNVKGDPVAGASGSGDNDADIIACGFPQGHSILIAWNSAIIENTQDNISKSSVFIDADVLGCINMRHQTTFNALYSAPDEPCGCRNSHMHINEIFESNDPGSGAAAAERLSKSTRTAAIARSAGMRSPYFASDKFCIALIPRASSIST